MTEQSERVVSMINHLKNMDKIQADMIFLLQNLDSQMNKLQAEYLKFNEVGQEANQKKVIDLTDELDSIEPISFGQNIKELQYEIETSRADLMPYQSYLKKMV
ncbi:hypothetical protein LNP18_05995 [Leuconostoc citreum]|uniref:hypothetical protein n=1 Tax=Leuconostoc citreum TaxID=33964 RepID=UPI00200AE09B|nr:hypothetical protein [Leuconostoc citreum]MCK8605653.1 hypothetical protein [Leuconostoc citreum]